MRDIVLFPVGAFSASKGSFCLLGENQALLGAEGHRRKMIPFWYNDEEAFMTAARRNITKSYEATKDGWIRVYPSLDYGKRNSRILNFLAGLRRFFRSER